MDRVLQLVGLCLFDREFLVADGTRAHAGENSDRAFVSESPQDVPVSARLQTARIEAEAAQKFNLGEHDWTQPWPSRSLTSNQC